MKKLKYPPRAIWGTPKREHDRLSHLLCYNKWLLEEALGIEYLWLQAREYEYDPVLTDEKCDLVFMDKFSPYEALKDTTCYIVEIKSDEADHEVLGQLKKYIKVMERKGKAIDFWNKVQGVAIARSFTNSGLELLKEEGFKCFIWNESNGMAELIRR